MVHLSCTARAIYKPCTHEAPAPLLSAWAKARRPLSGLTAIRSFFSQFFASSPPELLAAIALTHQEVTGEIAYIIWKAEPFIPFASDTFLIRDDTIVVQTFAMAG
jgi:hypothetical protein